MDKKERIEYCLEQLKKVIDGQAALTTHRELSIKHFNADPSIVKLIKNRSEVTTTDFGDTVQSAKSYIISTLMDADDVIFPPEGPSDVKTMEALSMLTNKHVKQRNPWFEVLNDFLDDTLRMKFGGIKAIWCKDKKYVYQEKVFNEEQYFVFLSQKPAEVELVQTKEEVKQEAVFDPVMNIEITPEVKEYTVLSRAFRETEYTKLQVWPCNDILFPVDTRNINDTFFALRCRMPAWKFKKQYGSKIFKKIEKNRKSFDSSENTIKDAQMRDLGKDFIYDDKKDEYISYECYYPDTDTGLPLISHIASDEEIMFEPNKYGCVPVVVATPYKLAHKVVGQDLFDKIKEYHKQRTNLLRQINDNILQANFRRYFVDYTRVNMKDYLDTNITNTAVRTEGDPSSCVMPEVKSPLPEETFQVWEILNAEKDSTSPVTRAFTGSAPKAVNRTARGQAQQYQQVASKLDIITETIVNMAIAPLFVLVANNIVQFMQKEEYVRVLDEFVPINPDNVVTQADYAVINVGLGSRNKDMLVANIQQLLGVYAQIFKVGVPVVSPDNVYEALLVLVKNMGFKDTSKFATNPKFMEGVKNLITSMIPSIMGMMAGQIPPDQKLLGAVMPLMQMMHIELPKPQQPPQQPQIAPHVHGEGDQMLNPPTAPVLPENPRNPSFTPGMAGGNYHV